MELLVAYQKDPAGHNIAKFISQELEKNGNVYKGKDFDLSIISSPVISADLLKKNLIMTDIFFYQNMQQNQAS